MSPLNAIHTISLLAVLAASPLDGCSNSGSSTPGSNNIAAPGGPSGPSGPSGGRGAPRVPHGGTPEPGTLLLLGGAAAGYLAVRRRRKATATEPENPA